MAGITQGIYNAFIRSNTTFLATIFTGAFAFQMAFNLGSDAVWDRINKGRQWKDIKQKYLQSAEAEGDDDDE